MTFDYKKELTNCPPSAAGAVSGRVFRGIPTPPISHKDFKSHNELGARGADPKVCMKWGLSVWRSQEAVENARQLHNYMRQWHIAAGELNPADGVIAPTPNPKNPDHHTLWLEERVVCVDRFEIVLEPLETR